MMFLHNFIKKFRVRPLSIVDVKRRYRKPYRFSQYLSVSDYLSDYNFYVLEDGFSLAVCFELLPIACDGKSDAYLANLQQNLQTILQNTIPEEDDPWVLQWYVYYEPGLHSVKQGISDYRQYLQSETTEFSQFYFNQILFPHLTRMGSAQGVFFDHLVSKNNFSGKRLRGRMCLYRRYSHEISKRKNINAIEPLIKVSESLISAFASIGVGLKVMSVKDFYSWLLAWFNPAPNIEGKSSAALLELLNLPENNLPFAEPLNDSFFFSAPRCDIQTGTIWFDNKPHTVLSIQALRDTMRPGAISAEFKQQDCSTTLIDRLPIGSIFSGTITYTAQDIIEAQLLKTKALSKGGTAKTELTTTALDLSLAELARGHKIYPLQLVVFLQANSLDQLRHYQRYSHTILNQSGFKTILSEHDLIPINTYINNLPINYRPEYDKLEKRSHYQFMKNIAALVPIYARAVGSGKPGCLAFNRGGEPFTFDIINERKKNAFMLLLAPPGAGKSAKLIDMILFMRAMMDVRLIFIEKGNSMGLVSELLEQKGCSVNRIVLNSGSGISLPPFVNSAKYAKQLLDKQQLSKSYWAKAATQRDFLAEMLTSAHLMYCGGDNKEILTRSEQGLLQRVLIRLSKEFYHASKFLLIEDVVKALRNLKVVEQYEKKAATKIAAGLELFTAGLAGEFFNRPGKDWQDVDVTHVELGELANKTHQDKLAVAIIGILNNVSDLAMRYEHMARHTIILLDEGHIILRQPLLVDYFVAYNKMARKLGLWTWIATQNIEDFQAGAEKIISMVEWIMTLATTKSQVDEIAKYKKISQAQRDLMLNAVKLPGKYTEGVVLSDVVNGLFRNVPPALVLALSMTEKHEKAARQQLMLQYNCSELEAAFMIAEKIKNGKWGSASSDAKVYV